MRKFLLLLLNKHLLSNLSKQFFENLQVDSLFEGVLGRTTTNDVLNGIELLEYMLDILKSHCLLGVSLKNDTFKVFKHLEFISDITDQLTRVHISVTLFDFLLLKEIINRVNEYLITFLSDDLRSIVLRLVSLKYEY